MTELEKARKKVAELEAKEQTDERSKYIRKLEDVTVEEKIEFYDYMFKDAMKMLERTEKTGCIDHETEYSWEAQMRMLGNPKNEDGDFWTYYGKLDD